MRDKCIHSPKIFFMKEILTNEQAIVSEKNPIQEKISFLNEKNLVWKEIATLTGLPKKLIKGIAKGKFIPTAEESNRLAKKIDDTIERLSISAETYGEDKACPEADLDAEGYECHTIGIKSMSFYKSRDDDRMFFQIHGIKLYD